MGPSRVLLSASFINYDEMNYMFGYSDTTRGFFFFRYLLFKFWQAILPFFVGDIFFIVF